MRGLGRLYRARDWGGRELQGRGAEGRGWAPLGTPGLGSTQGPAFVPGCCRGYGKPVMKGRGR